MLDICFKVGNRTAIKMLQKILSTFGYQIELNGVLDERTLIIAKITTSLYFAQILDQLGKAVIEYTGRERMSNRKTKMLANADKEMERSDRITIVKRFGERMKEARELANMSQTTAAKLLGYETSSKLAKVESASDTDSVPWFLVYKAANLYDVSTDFLYGLSEDWERDVMVSQQRRVGAWLFDHWKKTETRHLTSFAALNKKLATLEKVTSRAIEYPREILQALVRFQERNPEFIDMPGGSMFVKLIHDSCNHATLSRSELEKVHALLNGK